MYWKLGFDYSFCWVKIHTAVCCVRGGVIIIQLVIRVAKKAYLDEYIWSILKAGVQLECVCVCSALFSASLYDDEVS